MPGAPHLASEIWASPEGRPHSYRVNERCSRETSMSWVRKIPYKAGNPNAGVLNYEVAGRAIILEFADHRFRYVYNELSPGRSHVDAMIRLARHGKGLSTYV